MKRFFVDSEFLTKKNLIIIISVILVIGFSVSFLIFFNANKVKNELRISSNCNVALLNAEGLHTEYESLKNQAVKIEEKIPNTKLSISDYHYPNKPDYAKEYPEVNTVEIPEFTHATDLTLLIELKETLNNSEEIMIQESCSTEEDITLIKSQIDEASIPVNTLKESLQALNKDLDVYVKEHEAVIKSFKNALADAEYYAIKEAEEKAEADRIAAAEAAVKAEEEAKAKAEAEAKKAQEDKLRKEIEEKLRKEAEEKAKKEAEEKAKADEAAKAAESAKASS